MISKNVTRGSALAATMLLGACGSMSQYNGYVTASPEAAKVVEKGGFSEEAMAQIAIVQNPDFNGGRISLKALRKIQKYAISCQQQVDPQLAGAAQAALTGAVSNGAGGAVGTGLGAKVGFGSAVHALDYVQYGGIASFFLGVPYGLTTGSYALAQAKGDCTRQFWEDVVKTDPDFRGTHIVIVYAGKSMDSRPPALDKPIASPKGVPPAPSASSVPRRTY